MECCLSWKRFQHNLKHTARKWACLVIGSSVWMRGGKMENSVIFAVSQERYFYLWPRFSIKYWRWTSKDSFWWHDTEWWLCWSWKWHSAVWSGVSSVVCKERVRFPASALLSAPRIAPRVVFAMEKPKEARMRSGILQHLQRISLNIPNTGPKRRDTRDGVCL